MSDKGVNALTFNLTPYYTAVNGWAANSNTNKHGKSEN